MNGAGLAMATMDIISTTAANPPTSSMSAAAPVEGTSRRRVQDHPQRSRNVKGILVNIFGGIMDCNVIANGIVDAARETKIAIPLVVRLEGNNVEAGNAPLPGAAFH